MNLLLAMQIFRAVVDSGSFSDAARKSHRSKAVVSKMVSDLEAHLGVRLLNRSTRRLTMTEAGQRYYPRCVTVLSDVEELHGALRDAQTALRGHLRISAPQTFGEQYIMPLLARFALQEPAISFEVVFNDRYVDVIEERFDLAIRIGELADSSLVARRLGGMRLVVCASTEFLARYGTPASPTALAALPCIIDSNMKQPRTWSFMHQGQAQTVQVEGRFIVNSANAAVTLAERGLGCALVPDFVLKKLPPAHNLQVLFAEHIPPARGIHAVFPHRQYLTRRLRAVVDFFAAELAALLPVL
jgi:DNA-binding transcriptional LysR family regulator